MCSAYLFVYGSLKQTSSARLGAAERHRLSCEADFVGNGWINGRLVDLGAYPGLLVDGCSDGHVQGEVYLLHDASRSLPWLDAYEGIVRDHSICEYRRDSLQIDVFVPKSMSVTAWVYVLQTQPPGAQLMDGPVWFDR